MTRYTCEVCGKHLRPVLLWECVEDNEALHRGETVTLGDHVHTPDVVPGDNISAADAPQGQEVSDAQES